MSWLRSSPVWALMTVMLRSWTNRMGGLGVGSADADVGEAAPDAEGDFAGLVDAVVTSR